MSELAKFPCIKKKKKVGGAKRKRKKLGKKERQNRRGKKNERGKYWMESTAVIALREQHFSIEVSLAIRDDQSAECR